MCFYITATLPKGTLLDKFRKVLDKNRMEFSPIYNPIVQSQLRPGELYFRATKNYCDCETALGSLNKLQDYQTLYKSKKVKVLKKKNWSEEEIDNWIKIKLKSKQKKTGSKLSQLDIKNDTERWIGFLKSMLKNKKVARLGILKHWYSRGIEDESIKIKRTQQISINELTQELLLNLGEDILYEFLPINQ